MSDDKKPAEKEKMVTVRVLRDHWTGDHDNPERIRKGTIVEVPVEAAMDGMEAGALSRVK